MATKPTKQQLAQSKARAGGNNPIKVTSSGLKKLGTAAAIAASLTPVGRGAKIAGIIAKPISKAVQTKSVKNTKVVVEKIAKMQEKTRAEKIASNSVKVKPAAKRMGNPPDAAKTQFKNDSSRQRASDRAYRDATFLEAQGLDNLSFSSSNASNAAKYVGKNAKLQRKPNLPAKTKPKPPNPSQIENRLGMANNRMIDRGVPVEARAAAGRSRRDAIAESKLTGKPRKDTKPKLVPPKVNKNDRWQFEQWDD